MLQLFCVKEVQENLRPRSMICSYSCALNTLILYFASSNQYSLIVVCFFIYKDSNYPTLRNALRALGITHTRALGVQV